MRKLIENNYVYTFALLIIMLISTYLNYYANRMEGLVHYYEEYALYLQSFLKIDNALTVGTWPMWGYGFILLFFKSKLIIILFQQTLTIAVIFYAEYILKQYKICSKLIFRYRLFILISVNLFFVQSSLCPDGIGLNLLAISMLSLVLYFKNYKYWMLLLSSITFGIMLNFRSDFYYFQFVLVIIFLSLRFSKISRMPYKYIFLWFFIIQMLLIPWGLHTKNITGSYLQTSTNGGHVMLIGLGQLPNNPWGISPHDGDSVMRNILSLNGEQNTASCEYSADKVLKKQWAQFVTENPLVFLKKCSFNVYRVLRNPFYVGDIDKRFLSTEDSRTFRKQIKKHLNNWQITQALNMIITPPYTIFIFSFLLNLWGICIFLLFLYSLIKYVFFSAVSVYRDPLLIILLALIFYQLSILILFFFMPFYHMGTLLFYILLIFILKQKIIYFSSAKIQE